MSVWSYRHIDMVTLGNRVKELRVSRGWRQVDLARKSGVSQRAVSNLERGGGGRESATLTTVVNIADAFGLPVWQLLADDEIYKESDLNQLIKRYIKSNTDGRRAIDRIAEIESRYHSVA